MPSASLADAAAYAAEISFFTQLLPKLGEDAAVLAVSTGISQDRIAEILELFRLGPEEADLFGGITATELAKLLHIVGIDLSTAIHNQSRVRDD